MKNFWLFISLFAFMAFAPNIGKKIDTINNKKLEYIYSNNPNKPIVILEHGLGGNIEDWKKVIPLIANDYSVYVYNRPGYGKSDIPNTPRDAENIITELRANLNAQGIKPPFIYVGHSLGGLYGQYYAKKYPEDLRGIVLVDSTHPRQFTGDGAYEKWPKIGKFYVEKLLSKTGQDELFTSVKSGEQVLSLNNSNTKMVILSASKPLKDKSKLGIDGANKRYDMEKLYPNAKVIWVNSGHMIPIEAPNEIKKAIDEIAAN